MPHHCDCVCSVMSLHCMPLLITNLGGEMLYILDQRLQAQNIAIDKSKRVLQDVMSTMFSTKFIEELFKPQEMYSNASTRQIFDRLAHSSIMRLNESSMDKLYDLMTMGVKYQMLASTQASDLLQVTLTHFDSLLEIAQGSEVQPLLESARALTVERYGPMTVGSWTLLRQTFARFFQDRKVKVSLFLQENIQLNDGSFVLSSSGALPVITATPGSIRYFSNGRMLSETRVDTSNVLRNVYKPAHEFSADSEYRSSHLGTNMYSKNRKKPGDYPTLPAAACSPQAKRANYAASPSAALSESARKLRELELSKASKVEMNLLAQLVNVQRAPHDNFTLQLFQESSDTSSGGGGGNTIIMFDASDKKESRSKEIEKQMGGFSIDDKRVPAPIASAGDDLLDLLDSAS